MEDDIATQVSRGAGRDGRHFVTFAQTSSAYTLWTLSGLSVCANATSVRAAVASVALGAAIHPGVRQGVRMTTSYAWGVLRRWALK